MSNTIDLLETIGRNASLRHASGEELSQALSGLQASEAFKQAAISGDVGHLVTELGHRDVKTPNHVSNNLGGGHEDDEQGGKHQPDDHDDDDNKGAEDQGKSG